MERWVYKGRCKYRPHQDLNGCNEVILKHGKTDKDLHNLRQEIEILQKLKHENIIEMIDSFETSQEFCVITEFAQMPKQIGRKGLTRIM
ncbi:hypothetical protein EJB05_12522, partial [Eragrostis curvula]